MVTFAAARDVLKNRLDAVFGSSAFVDLYGCTVPQVYQGFPLNEPPFYVAVDEIIDTASSQGAATMGHAQLDFTLRVWALAQHADLKTAADCLLSYIDVIFNSVLADQQLKHTVDNCFPQIETAGTAADSKGYYIAAASIAVKCSVFSVCPCEILEVIHESNC